MIMKLPTPTLLFGAIVGLLSPAVNATTSASTGNITLFSDANCAKPVFVNSFTLGIGHCAAADSVAIYPNAYESFTLNQRPVCDSGTKPTFDVYSDLTCTNLTSAYAPGVSEQGSDGSCVASRRGFKSFKFICPVVVTTTATPTTITKATTNANMKTSSASGLTTTHQTETADGQNTATEDATSKVHGNNGSNKTKVTDTAITETATASAIALASTPIGIEVVSSTSPGSEQSTLMIATEVPTSESGVTNILATSANPTATGSSFSSSTASPTQVSVNGGRAETGCSVFALIPLLFAVAAIFP